MRDYSAAALKEGVSQETIGVYAQTRSLQRTSTLKLNTRYIKACVLKLLDGHKCLLSWLAVFKKGGLCSLRL